ncbi:MAG: hypothetical protein KME27_24720 [Lyngbya sp. HA4199-MV5]|jgi:hypothetical protein|nr:hypothetical protein [Lyngbya sp. HA4199-MV5]
MARPKRNSAVLERADRRNESLRSINPELDFGGGLTVAAYTTTIDDLRSKLAAYNTALSAIDKLADDVKSAERVATEMSEKMLLGVGSRFGKASQEYEMAGGSRRKNRRRSTMTAPSTTTTPSATAFPTASAPASNGAAPVTVA